MVSYHNTKNLAQKIFTAELQALKFFGWQKQGTTTSQLGPFPQHFSKFIFCRAEEWGLNSDFRKNQYMETLT
jgi:hypothetical protein